VVFSYPIVALLAVVSIFSPHANCSMKEHVRKYCEVLAASRSVNGFTNSLGGVLVLVLVWDCVISADFYSSYVDMGLAR